MTLKLAHLAKRFSSFTVGPLSLEVDDVMVMIGPTGSGKTTILNLIAGMIKPDEGSVVLNGMDITDVPVESRKIGYVFQTPSLFPHLNVYENIVFGLPKAERHGNNPRIKKLLEDMGISHLAARNVQSLSGGEMQKISLARMLAVEPAVMLLDEPLAHLDPPMRRKMRLELRRILKMQNIPAVYVTHFEEDVYALADSVSILRNGRIERMGRLESILTSTDPFLSEIIQEGNYIEGSVVETRKSIAVIRVDSHILESLGEYSAGTRVGMIVRPEEIIVSKEFVKTSARNVIRMEVVSMEQRNGVVELQLKREPLLLKARVTEEARNDLTIKSGDYVYAIFKAISPQVVREES
jgi:molybdopterin-binding protein